MKEDRKADQRSSYSGKKIGKSLYNREELIEH